MKRREAIAGVASLGTLGSGVALWQTGVPSFGGETDSSERDSGNEDDGPPTVRTIDAGASEAGTQVLPPEGTISVLNFFVTYCGYCKQQMGPLAEARAEIDDDVRFLSITTQTIGKTLEKDRLREWWKDYDGAWDVGHGSTYSFRQQYDVIGTPVTLVIDEAGETVLNSDASIVSSGAIVGAVNEARDGESA
ncbi:TlpA disulfide reductase family protein [Halostagnicola kamekurae]|uniref:AhpC/TSA family protein n=1 Tax=Halostagnicola kamekurae TaxID=619731 RepID=A0A1I6S7V7_9EURY|nr:TlpA disulfide reductase family protein [Halostagnicola kamekurae]SFS72960.1 AhpC/TSA family protein [Halostagnicola kamekurae]